jgi:antitoxin (DNA-binding transcriptional repressor) of toxin-antitoxin stability system
MMTTIPLEEVQAHLSEIIDRLRPGQPLVITCGDRPVARLLAEDNPKRKPRKAGNCKGMLVIVADDDEHLFVP